MEFPNNLRKLRDAAGLSQAQIAEKLGVNQAEYSRIEKGRRRVGQHMNKLSKILKATDEQILSADQYQPTQMPEDVPVFALPEPDGESVRFDMAMASKIARPPLLKDAQNAFGMFNCGEAMSPRLRHGDFLFCDPDEKARDNDICALIIERGNRQVAIVRESLGGGVWKKLSDETEDTFENILKQVAPVLCINLAR